jgi:hypothetical protein
MTRRAASPTRLGADRVGLPQPRGPLSAGLIEFLEHGRADALTRAGVGSDALADEDVQLSLYVCYELHYRGFDGIDPELEWDPAVIALRTALERAFLAELESVMPAVPVPQPDAVGSLLFELAEADTGPSLSRHLAANGTAEQLREFVVHRSAYQLKEADPHSWAIPRLDGPAKAALLEVQFDEYGSGRADRIHAKLFADSMRALGLDGSYGAYLDRLPAHTLATVNVMSLFGLHRRWRGAIIGHLALFEITSPEPNRRYANALRRLGFEQATPFFDEHVEADSIHENIAAYDLAGGLARQEPELVRDILFGAVALLTLEGRWAERLLGSWSAGESSLLRPLANPDPDPEPALA